MVLIDWLTQNWLAPVIQVPAKLVTPRETVCYINHPYKLTVVFVKLDWFLFKCIKFTSTFSAHSSECKCWLCIISRQSPGLYCMLPNRAPLFKVTVAQ